MCRESIGIQLHESSWVQGLAQLTITLPMVQGIAILDKLRAVTENAPHGEQGIAIVNALTNLVVKSDVSRETKTSGTVPITVNLVISDATLFGVNNEPAEVLGHTGRGYGDIPPEIARKLVADGIDANSVWLRKIYADSSGQLVAMTSQQRFFSSGLAHAIRVRDHGICTTPWCGAPLRHLDHVKPHSDSGATTLENGASLCAKCNLTKDTHDWNSTPEGITDPTGTQYPVSRRALPTPATDFTFPPQGSIIEKILFDLTT